MFFSKFPNDLAIRPGNGEDAGVRPRRGRNEVTLQSVQMFTEYEPGADIEWGQSDAVEDNRRGRGPLNRRR